MAESASPSLSVRTAAGAGWIIMWRMSTRLLGIASTVVLVRLLAPADFGLVALATSFAQLVDSLASMGVAEALVRETHVDRTLYNTGFTLNLLRGLVMAGGILAAADPVALFFGDPRLAHILQILAIVSFLSSIENVGVVDFRRDLTFDREFRLSVIPRIAGVLASIVSAFILVNYWALIIGLLARAILRLGLTYWMHPFRPGLTLLAWRRIIHFSFWTWTSVIVMMIRDRADTFVIGRVLGPMTVGIYSVGWEIGSLTSTELVEPITAALFAGFSAGRRTGVAQAEGYLRAISMTFLLTLPMGMGLSLIASPVIHLAFGPRWMQAAPLVQVFALICMLKVIAYFSGVLLNANGMIHIQFRILSASLIVRLALLLALIHPLGLMGAVIAAAGCMLVEEVLFLLVTFRHFDLTPSGLMRGIWRSLLATAAMAGVLVWEGIGWAPAPDDTVTAIWSLVIGIGSGALSYSLVLLGTWLLCGRPSGAERALWDLGWGMVRHFFVGRRRVGS